MSGAAPLFTVAIPSIGRMQYLPALLRSVEAQTLGDFEALILDNASPAEARDCFADVCRRDRRFRVVRVDERIPMFANFQRGWLEMRGRFLAYFHDDDVFLPQFLARHAALLQAEPGVGFSGCNIDFIDADDRVTEERRWIARDHVMPGRRFIRFVASRGRNLVNMQCIAYRKEALAPLGLDPSLSPHYGDFVVMMRMAERAGVGLLADPLVRVRRHTEQASVKGWTYSAESRQRTEVMWAYVREFEQRNPDDRQFAKVLAKDIRRSVRVGALWGWVNAADGEESERCIAPLDASSSRTDHVLARLMRLDDAAGVKAGRRRRLVPAVRAVGNRFRL